MAKTKVTTEAMRNAVTRAGDNTPEGPTFGDDPEALALATYAHALKTGDEAEVDRMAGKLLLGPNTINLHKLALREHAELTAAAEPQAALTAEVESLEDEILRLKLVRATTIKEAENVAARIQEATSRLDRARYELSLAHVAENRRAALAGWCGPIFSLPSPPGGVALHVDSETRKACEAAGIDPGTPGAWRGRTAAAERRPRRRLVSVDSPLNKRRS